VLLRRFRVTIGVRIRFSVWLVSCYVHVFVRLWVVIATHRTDVGLTKPHASAKPAIAAVLASVCVV